MIARGSRSLDAQQGTIFFVGKPYDEMLARSLLKEHKGRKFEDAALILKAVKSLGLSEKAQGKLNAMLKNAQGEWICSKETFMAKQSKEMVGKLTKLFRELK